MITSKVGSSGRWGEVGRSLWYVYAIKFFFWLNKCTKKLRAAKSSSRTFVVTPFLTSHKSRGRWEESWIINGTLCFTSAEGAGLEEGGVICAFIANWWERVMQLWKTGHRENNFAAYSMQYNAVSQLCHCGCPFFTTFSYFLWWPASVV